MMPPSMPTMKAFHWKNGGHTYLWPDYPLVLAGDDNLATIVNGKADGVSINSIVAEITASKNIRLDNADGIVREVHSAISQAENGSINDLNRPDHQSLSMATLNLTSACNLRCNHCYAASRLSDCSSDTKIEGVERAISQLAKIIVRDPKLLILSGGEPLLDKRKLRAAVVSAREHGLMVRLNTNGLLLAEDEELASFLAGHRVHTQVSLDGIDAKTHALLRNDAGSHALAVAAIKLLVSKKCPTRISMTVHSRNVHQIPEMLDWAIELGVDQFITSSLVKVGNALTSDVDVVEFGDEFEILHGAVESNKRKQEMTRSTLLAETIQAIRNGMRFIYCGTGCSTLCVDADGTCYPCINLVDPRFAFGNIAEDDLSAAWEESPTLLELRRLDVDSMNPQCSQCMFRRFCGGYCRGENIANGLGLRSPYVRCRSWKRGLLKVLEILAKSPGIYENGTEKGWKHHG